MRQLENPKKKEVMVILGTKAETIKMSPVLRELVRRGIPYFLLHTGQHDISNELNELGLRTPDAVLEKSTGRGRFSNAIHASFWNFGKLLLIRLWIKSVSPKIVLIHGDTMTTATAAIATRSFLSHRPLLAHVEAGLRSHNLREPFPEEISRRIADCASDILFCPTAFAAENVKNKHKRGKCVFVVGNTNIDSLKYALKKGNINPDTGRAKKNPYLLAKLHRQENIKSEKRLSEFVKILENAPMHVEFILADNTRRKMKKFGIFDRVSGLKHVSIRKDMPYIEFLKLFAGASCILTDGGGETEEACFLKVPCIEFRRFSERQEAERAGIAIRWNGNTSIVIKLIESIAKIKPKHIARAKNPYGDGTAGAKIVAEIEKIISA